MSSPPDATEQEVWVRQCTTCGRADLRDWFPSAGDVPESDWACQLCEQAAFRVRDLREMLLGRLPAIAGDDA